MKNKKELSLYIHIPFCVRKCRYCDFFSAPASFEEKEQYVCDLIQSIYEQGREYQDYEVISLFLGGGTPSALEAEWLKKILHAVTDAFTVLADAEITMEVNPGTVDEEKWTAYKEAGINRVSIGLQSANDEELCLLGRIHTYEDFLQCFYGARKAGFTNINIDLISSIPGQTLESYQETIRKVLALKPEHISAYSLILEENTAFYQMFLDSDGKEKTVFQNGKEYRLLTEEEDREIYHLTKKLLLENGYERYEISNYAKPGYECRHNMVYWRRGNYLGLGSGAASLIENVRFVNEKKAPFSHTEIEELTRNDQMAEFMFLGLRTTKGVSKVKFRETFEQDIEKIYGKQLAKLSDEGILVTKIFENEEYLALTEFGLDISNYAMSEFILSDE